jgi:glycosyltransferase involved in cell wall biosynthesis
VEKNLDLLADAFKAVCRERDDVALVLAGEGPHAEALRARLAGLPTFLLGRQEDDALARLYASSDLLVFPSTTDTLGQVVLEAQASGLPALVSTHGGPRELVEDEVTGRVLSPTDASAWSEAILSLLEDARRRAMMSDAAVRRMARYSLRNTFAQFWERHLQAVRSAEGADAPVAGDVAAAAQV